MAAALNSKVVLLVKVFLALGLHLVGSVLSVPESSRREAGAGDFALLDDRGRVTKGQRRQVLGKRGPSADEVVLVQVLRQGEGCRHDAFDELSKHWRSVEI